MTRGHMRQFEVAEMKMLGWACGHTRKDKIRNETIRPLVGVGNIRERLQQKRLTWFGNVMRRDEDYVGRQAMEMEVKGGGRRRWRPKLQWKDAIWRDMRKVALEDGD